MTRTGASWLVVRDLRQRRVDQPQEDGTGFGDLASRLRTTFAANQTHPV